MKLRNMYEKSEMFNVLKGGEIPGEAASLFVSGIILREIFFRDVSFVDKEAQYTFEQMWYLICLHHDKRFEQREIWEMLCHDTEKNKKIVQFEGKNLEIQCKWSPLPVIFSPEFCYEEGSIRFTNGAHIRKSILTESEIKDIFYFRNTCCKTKGMDHGIAGGLLLYENLVQQSYTREEGAKTNSRNLYSYLANTLLVHNILRLNKKRISLTPQEDPMLCLLLLAEAVDPLQYVREGEKENDGAWERILDHVYAEVEDKKLVLRVDAVSFPFERYAGNILGATQKAGMKCSVDMTSSKISIRMDESAIIDELFI